MGLRAAAAARSRFCRLAAIAALAACSTRSKPDPGEATGGSGGSSEPGSGGRTGASGRDGDGSGSGGGSPSGAGDAAAGTGGRPAPDGAPNAAADGRGAQDGSSAADRTPPPAPAGKVPMFVAAGYGGRTITSCDDGRTWIANHAYEQQNVDHSPYTEKGFLYGNGVFMLLMGWGAPGSVKLSRNGVDWKRVDMPRGGDGGLVFIDKPAAAFVALGGYGGCQTSRDGGETWSRCPAPSYPENLREAGGGGPALGVGGDIAAMFSFDGGQRWRSGGACTLTNGFGNLGQQGGFAWGRDMFVAVASDGSWCQTADLGQTWKTGTLAATATGKMAFTGGRFWAPNGKDAHWTEDGVTWQRETFKPATVNIHAMARGDSGTYVGVERATASSRFFHSTDGVTWTLVQGPSGTSLRRVVFGYGEPSAQCPAR